MIGDQSLSVDGIEINIVDIGSKNPTLIFLHYWGGSSRTWCPAMKGLSATNRCVAIDFRGWGRSSKITTNYDLHTLADDVGNVIEQLGLDDCIIVGHSMGGKVAQLVAARRPHGLERLILVAPAPPTPLDVPEEQRRGMVASYGSREGIEAAIGVLAALPLSAAHREQVIEDTLGGAPDAKRAWPERGMIEDVSDQASMIDVPVHVIVGSADGIESESSLHATLGKVIPDTEFIVLPGVGHLAPLEATAEVVDAIRHAQGRPLRQQDMVGGSVPKPRPRNQDEGLDDWSTRLYMTVMSTQAHQDTSGVRRNILATGQRIMAGRGFSAVGLNEILAEAGVPKGSFYHYFGSKDAFGEAILAAYFEDYIADLDETLRRPGLTMAERLMAYWQQWQETQSFSDCQGKCLAVKLGPEVADLSEAMRSALKQGTTGIINRLRTAIATGVAEGSLAVDGDPGSVAQSLYQLWLGASVMVKIVRNTQPFESAVMATRQILHLPAP